MNQSNYTKNHHLKTILKEEARVVLFGQSRFADGNFAGLAVNIKLKVEE